VETVLIFVIATSGVAAVVWWASIPPSGPQRKSRPRLRFQETFQTTGPEPAAPDGGDGFALMDQSAAVPLAPEEHPNPVLSVVRLALTIALVSLVGVAVLGGLGYFLYRLIDGYFAGSVS
jgi:hypothetical protein